MIQGYCTQIFKISTNLPGGDLISWGNQFCRTAELFGPPFCISILKVLRSQIFCHSLGFNAFCMIQCTFLRLLEFPQKKDWGPNFFVGTNSAEQLNYKVLQSWMTQNLCGSIDLIGFYMTHQCFSQKKRNQMWRLTKAIAEMKLDTQQIMKSE